MGQKVLYGRAKKNGIVYPVRNNAPLGFESRYSGTGISNGVYSSPAGYHGFNFFDFGFCQHCVLIVIYTYWETLSRQGDESILFLDDAVKSY